MDLSNKSVVVIGLGKSGSSLVAFLDKQAKSVTAFDKNDSLKEWYSAQNFSNTTFCFGKNPTGDEEADLVVISPGIPTDLDFVSKLGARNIPIIGEAELAFQMAKGKFIGITGTNGKTTTTALVGELFKNAGFDTRVVGNIGTPIISQVENSDENTVFVTELSSFQLETIRTFHCDAATIINITPDHLNRHKTMENYVKAKARIFENQTKDDFAIINLDDMTCVELSESFAAKKIYTTVLQTPDLKRYFPALYLNDRQVMYYDGKEKRVLTSLDKVFLRGKHNYENVLIASGIAIAFGIEFKIIADTLEKFRGVAHRLEFVKEIEGVRFINDSKGTNPDASIKALEAVEKDIILIAGGMDKGSSFDSFVQAFSNRVKSVILLGETQNIIESSLKKYGFENYVMVNNMNEAVKTAYFSALEGDTVLLSPACASWDMYSCFEERGEHFKKIVNELEVKDGK